MKTMMPKVYLGDAVYAQFGEGFLKLTVEYWNVPEETIFLEPAVIEALMSYLKQVEESNERVAYTSDKADFQPE